MSPELRFSITHAYRHSSRARSGRARDGFLLVDALTGQIHRCDLLHEAKAKRAQILERESQIPWDGIASFDFNHRGRASQPCTEIYAYDEQGERLSILGIAPLTTVGYDPKEYVVSAWINLWLAEMGRSDLPRKRELEAERERRLLASAETVVVPGARNRLGALAERYASAA